ncbi:MAG: hypothetical protein ACE5EX_04835 [Phycisphaerae bacterium]
MSVSEVAGLVLTAGLLGAAVGIAVAAALIGHRHHLDRLESQRRQSLAGWLAARLTLNRASLSFAAAYRALAAERSGLEAVALRREEVQRARAAWCDALCDYDRAKAALLVWNHGNGLWEKLTALERHLPDAIQAALCGEPADLERLAARLRRLDVSSAGVVRSTLANHRTRSVHWPTPLARMADSFTGIMHRVGRSR